MFNHSSFSIVVVTYNRVKSIARLLNSLNDAKYDGDIIPLVISIDFSGKDDVLEFANNFQWDHGEKIIRTFKERQGLRNHILQCGSFTDKYDAIAVFEDDLYVSPNYYRYSKQAIEFYKNNDNVAGISLYGFENNYNNGFRFMPLKGEYDSYFLNIAQSWGQIWIRDMWKNFKFWYDLNNQDFGKAKNLPDSICEWPSSSWLKYHTKYCIENNKYFVYPYVSLSTNFGDSGEHKKFADLSWHVMMQYGDKRIFNFAPFNKESIVYDAFFESKKLSAVLNVQEESLCIDLYGDKQNKEEKRYWLTLEKKDFKIIRSYALVLKPWEMNIINNISGKEIFLYDTSEVKLNKSKTTYPMNIMLYNIGKFNKRLMWVYFKSLIRFFIVKNK